MAAAMLGVAWLTAAFVGGPAGGAAPVRAETAMAGVMASASPPTIGGCQVFPSDNVWNTRIDSLPVHARSDAWISSIGSTTGLKADYGSGLWDGAPIGIPYTTAPGTQPAVSIGFDFDDESDTGSYRIPPDAPIEGGSDHHVLVVNRDRCLLTELWDATKNSDADWWAGSGAFFDLGSNALRPAGWTSADAAGLPILPGLVRYDEMAAGEITHALRFTAQQTQQAYIWPARHLTYGHTSPNVPPMGARVRLKSSIVVANQAVSPQVKVILTAIQRYGMFLADNGSNWYMSGVPDERWDNDALQKFSTIKGNMLEFVDESSLMVDPNSGQVRSAGPTQTPTSTRTPTPTSTSTLPPTATTIPTSTLTPTPRPSCAPRPAARVSLARTVPGQLDVTVTAGVGSGAPNNRVRALRFGAPTNARILVGGQAVTGGTRLALPAGPAQTTFSVEQVNASAAATVPLVVEDDCGDWSTFVGGGPSAW